MKNKNLQKQESPMETANKKMNPNSETRGEYQGDERRDEMRCR